MLDARWRRNERASPRAHGWLNEAGSDKGSIQRLFSWKRLGLVSFGTIGSAVSPKKH